jgi:hypothetical protein
MALLGTECVNAAHKMLMKLSPGLVKLFKNPFFPTDVRQKQACHSFELRNNRYKVNPIKLKNCKFTKNELFNKKLGYLITGKNM